MLEGVHTTAEAIKKYYMVQAALKKPHLKHVYTHIIIVALIEQTLASIVCRFVKKQLVVEITSSAKLAHLFGWIMRRHSLIAYSLYTAGGLHLKG